MKVKRQLEESSCLFALSGLAILEGNLPIYPLVSGCYLPAFLVKNESQFYSWSFILSIPFGWLMLNLVTVVIADDHALVREGLKTILKSQSGISVLGMAENGGRGGASLQALNPDVALMDLSMPIKSGVQAIQELSGEGKTKFWPSLLM